MKRHLLLGRKAMTNLDSIVKSRDIFTLPTKFYLVKAMVFPVVMYGYESWTIRKAERRRIDAFELWCWRRLLKVPWTTRRSNQSILKEISPEYSLERLMLTLQYFDHLMQKNWLLGKDPDAGKDRGQKEKGTTEDEMVGWLHRLDGHESEQAPGVGDGQGGLARCSPWGRGESDSTERLNRTDACVLSLQPCPTPATPGTATRQAPLSMEVSRQEYWSGLPFPIQGILLTQGFNLPLLCLLL